MDRADVLVLGAGPAGAQAALEAAEAGARVRIVDAYERPGGQYHRQPSARLRAATPGALHHRWRHAEARRRRLEELPGVELACATRAWAAEPLADGGVRVHLAGEREGHLDAGVLILATGAVERVVPFPGWDLPGVLTAGGAQAMLKAQGVRPGRRVVLAGAGPLLLPVAATLLRADTGLIEICDAAAPSAWLRAAPAGWHSPGKLVEAAGHVRRLAAARVPYRPGSAVVAADGDGRVEEVTVARVDERWAVVEGTRRTVAADAVCVSHGFTPSVELAAALGCELDAPQRPPTVAVDSLQRTSVPGVLAAGEATGTAGAAAAEAEGGVAGLAAARELGLAVDVGRGRRHTRARRREHRAAAALAPLTRTPDGWRTWLTPATVICRCEEVPYERLHHAVTELGATDLRSAKMTTRCGMGYCQARVCGPNVGDLVRALTGQAPTDPAALSTRAIVTPVPLGRL